jgi:hypothetical protein
MKNKKSKLDGSWKVKFIFYFMQKTQPLHLDILSTVKDCGHIYEIYMNNFLFDKAFNYGDGTKFYGYVGTNSEPLCTIL